MSERPAILMERRGSFLAPCTPADGARIEQFPTAKRLKVKVSQGRSSAQLRLYFTLLDVVADNLDQPGVTGDDLHEWLKVKLGYVKPIRLRNGEIAEVAASVAFDKMEQPEFNAYFDAVKDLLTKHVIPRVRSETLEREARLMLGEAA